MKKIKKVFYLIIGVAIILGGLIYAENIIVDDLFISGDGTPEDPIKLNPDVVKDYGYDATVVKTGALINNSPTSGLIGALIADLDDIYFRPGYFLSSKTNSISIQDTATIASGVEVYSINTVKNPYLQFAYTKTFNYLLTSNTILKKDLLYWDDDYWKDLRFNNEFVNIYSSYGVDNVEIDSIPGDSLELKITFNKKNTKIVTMTESSPEDSTDWVNRRWRPVVNGYYFNRELLPQTFTLRQIDAKLFRSPQYFDLSYFSIKTIPNLQDFVISIKNEEEIPIFNIHWIKNEGKLIISDIYGGNHLLASYAKHPPMIGYDWYWEDDFNWGGVHWDKKLFKLSFIPGGGITWLDNYTLQFGFNGSINDYTTLLQKTVVNVLSPQYFSEYYNYVLEKYGKYYQLDILNHQECFFIHKDTIYDPDDPTKIINKASHIYYAMLAAKANAGAGMFQWDYHPYNKFNGLVALWPSWSQWRYHPGYIDNSPDSVGNGYLKAGMQVIDLTRNRTLGGDNRDMGACFIVNTQAENGGTALYLCCDKPTRGDGTYGQDAVLYYRSCIYATNTPITKFSFIQLWNDSIYSKCHHSTVYAFNAQNIIPSLTYGSGPYNDVHTKIILWDHDTEMIYGNWRKDSITDHDGGGFTHNWCYHIYDSLDSTAQAYEDDIIKIGDQIPKPTLKKVAKVWRVDDEAEKIDEGDVVFKEYHRVDSLDDINIHPLPGDYIISKNGYVKQIYNKIVLTEPTRYVTGYTTYKNNFSLAMPHGIRVSGVSSGSEQNSAWDDQIYFSSIYGDYIDDYTKPYTLITAVGALANYDGKGAIHTLYGKNSKTSSTSYSIAITQDSDSVYSSGAFIKPVGIALEFDDMFGDHFQWLENGNVVCTDSVKIYTGIYENDRGVHHLLIPNADYVQDTICYNFPKCYFDSYGKDAFIPLHHGEVITKKKGNRVKYSYKWTITDPKDAPKQLKLLTKNNVTITNHKVLVYNKNLWLIKILKFLHLL